MTSLEDIRATVTDPKYTYRQRVAGLANLAENLLDPPAVRKQCSDALSNRIICDMYEGNAPYRPRYLLPDYKKVLVNGSAFLELPPAKDLDDALAFLLIMYSATPSITGYPVYFGDLDTLLLPYIEGVIDEDLYAKLKRFWISLDRMFPDAFAHTNLSPVYNRVAKMIFRLERELLQVVPNISLKVDPVLTSDEYILDAVNTVFACGKPHFINDPMMQSDLGPEYAAVSCYNSLKIGGGSHTLVRINLKATVEASSDGIETFFESTLPYYLDLTAELMESRILYLVEESHFFESDWLINEKLLELDKFSAMFGVFGLAEAVNILMSRAGLDGMYGHSTVADDLGYRITSFIAEWVAQRKMPYCQGNGGAAFLHSQSGIDLDIGVTAGTRIPIGTEPALIAHLKTVARHHHLFKAGISDVLSFDETAVKNPQAVVDVIRGAFKSGMRDFTFNLDSNDFIRITGYLVRKSDLAKLPSARHGSTYLGAGSVADSHVDQRIVKRVTSAESSPSPSS
ncbi:MAG: YjjI family glycine radical enzyme [Streptomycetaceae bacterium]|nr:MAG: YjjI family glycine radical enzyme [Streptomycetaceae bacterium]